MYVKLQYSRVRRGFVFLLLQQFDAAIRRANGWPKALTEYRFVPVRAPLTAADRRRWARNATVRPNGRINLTLHA
jgi:hypothetical protein